MKKTLFFVMVALIAASCEKVVLSDEGISTKMVKNVNMRVNGDFGSPTFTRSLMADGKEMTDLWVFDYVNDELVQTIHQTADDSDFGEPNILMEYGEHKLYFVASRGLNPDVDDVEHTITWSNVRDTFWKTITINVNSTSANEVDVTLERVVTKLKLNIQDKVPTGLVNITITPEEWNFGIDYITGEPASVGDTPISIFVPSSYVGTTGNLSVSIFSLSGASEWTTNVTVTAKNDSNGTISSVNIDNVPLMTNRATVYSGTLFKYGITFTLSLTDVWLSEKILTW